MNKKQVQRIRRGKGLQVPPPEQRLFRQRLFVGLPPKATHRNHVWCWDFVSDYTQRGGKLRVFNLIDEYTREGNECVTRWGAAATGQSPDDACSTIKTGVWPKADFAGGGGAIGLSKNGVRG